MPPWQGRHSERIHSLAQNGEKFEIFQRVARKEVVQSLLLLDMKDSSLDADCRNKPLARLELIKRRVLQLQPPATEQC